MSKSRKSVTVNETANPNTNHEESATMNAAATTPAPAQQTMNLNPPAAPTEPTPAPSVPENGQAATTPADSDPSTRGTSPADSDPSTWSTSVWQGMAKADAVRHASRTLGDERSATKVCNWLKTNHGIEVKAPHAGIVIRRMYGELRDKQSGPTAEAIKSGLALIFTVQKAAKEAGGLAEFKAKVEEAEKMLAFAATVGGMEGLKTTVDAMLAQS